ncbi:VOC family protein [Oerskovia flava]|uniref:VOC family protein n=1 Tax=Oerskovia flava TaxID=2986422 RepID=UPI0022407004|nr:VOC family protein [Oerskovia sp. JB1-3-2]
MTTQIFVNLPVADLEKAKDFYTRLGYTVNEQFTDENASAIVISDAIHVMLLTRDFFSQFTGKDLADTATTVAVINALSVDSREAVDALVDLAVAAGGSETRTAQDEGWMYSRAFADPDGHQWESLYMDASAAEG